MCLEVVRTRAFAALLSDEVFADIDLETVQVSQPIKMPRANMRSRKGVGGFISGARAFCRLLNLRSTSSVGSVPK